MTSSAPVGGGQVRCVCGLSLTPRFLQQLRRRSWQPFPCPNRACRMEHQFIAPDVVRTAWAKGPETDALHSTFPARLRKESTPAQRSLARQMGTLKYGDHVCTFFSGAAGAASILSAWMSEARRRQEWCVHLDDSRVRGLVEGYKKAGARGLWVAVDMTWMRDPDIGAEGVAAWEGMWKDLIVGMPVVLLCMYDRQRFDPAFLKPELHTHPFLISDGRVYPNAYYEGGALPARQEYREGELEGMLASIQHGRRRRGPARRG